LRTFASSAAKCSIPAKRLRDDPFKFFKFKFQFFL
jgi:hypothetical protein